jgi:peptidyl-prolyl cis-trans isomerase-like 1
LYTQLTLNEAAMDKLKKLFKHDSSDEKAASHTQGQPDSSATTSAQAPQASNAAGSSLRKPGGVLMVTNYGDITIALFTDKTPKACAFS